MDEKATPNYPVPADHTLQVYSAIIGHRPAVVPAAEPEPAPEPTLGATVRRLAGGAWTTLCNQWFDTLPPEARTRMAPFFASIKRGCSAAYKRLIQYRNDRAAARSRAAAPAAEAPSEDHEPAPSEKANGNSINGHRMDHDEILPRSYPMPKAVPDRQFTLARAEPDAEAQTPWSFNDRA